MDLTQIFTLIGIFLVYFFGSISGGTGLIVRPLLILGGLPPQVAIGTARLAHVFTRLAGLSQFHKHKKIDWRLSLVLFIPATLGGYIGAKIVVNLDEALITKIIGITIILFGLILFFNKKQGIEHPDSHRKRNLLKSIFGHIVVMISNIFASVTGGSGIMFSYALIFLFDQSYITSSAIRKVAGFGGSVSSIVVFIKHGLIDWRFALLMAIVGGVGAYLGVNYGIKKGEKWVRAITLLVIFIVGIKMIFFD